MKSSFRFQLTLKDGVTLERFSHRLRLEEATALAIVLASLGLRCKLTGRVIRRNVHAVVPGIGSAK